MNAQLMLSIVGVCFSALAAALTAVSLSVLNDHAARLGRIESHLWRK